MWRRDLKKTVKTWENKPTFKVSVKVDTPSQPVYTVRVWTDYKVYKWLDEGTKPHEIVSVFTSMLRFHEGYNAKTQPGVIDSRSGGEYGENVFKEEVWHPGVEARNFYETISEKQRAHIQKKLQKRFELWAKLTGHTVKVVRTFY